MWDEITYTLANFTGASLEMNKWFHPTLYWTCDYLSMLELKLIHVKKNGPGVFIHITIQSIAHKLYTCFCDALFRCGYIIRSDLILIDPNWYYFFPISLRVPFPISGWIAWFTSCQWVNLGRYGQDWLISNECNARHNPRVWMCRFQFHNIEHVMIHKQFNTLQMFIII